VQFILFKSGLQKPNEYFADILQEPNEKYLKGHKDPTNADEISAYLFFRLF
jgi:hypothetical protein